MQHSLPLESLQSRAAHLPHALASPAALQHVTKFKLTTDTNSFIITCAQECIFVFVGLATVNPIWDCIKSHLRLTHALRQA